jgi:hypothetical protein
MDKNELMNSCLMLAVNLETPVSLGCLFDEADLKDTGVEVESHITLLYAQGKEIESKGLLGDIKDILGPDDYGWLEGMIKSKETYKLLDSFDLGKFENDSDYLILKLRKETALYRVLSLINKSLSIKYNVKSDFLDYIPHLSLAELKPGTVDKYLESETVLGVLEDSVYSLEDILISYGLSNEPEDRKQKYLTSYSCIDRFFRIIRLKKELMELL